MEDELRFILLYSANLTLCHQEGHVFIVIVIVHVHPNTSITHSFDTRYIVRTQDTTNTLRSKIPKRIVIKSNTHENATQS